MPSILRTWLMPVFASASRAAVLPVPAGFAGDLAIAGRFERGDQGFEVFDQRGCEALGSEDLFDRFDDRYRGATEREHSLVGILVIAHLQLAGDVRVGRLVEAVSYTHLT